MSAHNHDDELIRQTIGKRLQQKADETKEEKIKSAILNTDISGLSPGAARVKLKKAVDDAIEG